MKKKFFNAVSTLAIAAIVALNVHVVTSKQTPAFLKWDVIGKILASGASGSGSGSDSGSDSGSGSDEPSTYTCINSPVYGGISAARACGSCKFVYFVSSYSSISSCTPD